MIVVSVLYPKTPTSHFDHDYYLHKHIPLVASTWAPNGFQGAELIRGTATPDGATPPYELIGLLTFATLDGFNDALAAHGATILGDIPNFTNVQPIIQVNDPIPL